MEPTIILCEPDPAILRLYVLILHELGYKTEACRSADDAWDALQRLAGSGEARLCAAVVDAALPGEGGGLALARRVREDGRFDGVPILLTSIDPAVDRKHADRFLRKPFDIDDFAEHVKALFAP